jgi:putative transposase
MPGPNTSKPAPENKVYPYLLRGVEITRPNQVWSTDITYIRVGRGFVYLTAVIDWYSRYVLSWELSNTLDSSFCIEATRRALQLGTPEIFNTDQGSQYTSRDFQAVFEGTGVAISMDGRGRALDNVFVERLWRSVKYEDIYLRDYQSMPDLYRGLIRYFHHYNHTRPHQSLDHKTPAEIHNSCAVVAPLRPRPFGPPLRGRSPQSDDSIPCQPHPQAWGTGTKEQQNALEPITP